MCIAKSLSSTHPQPLASLALQEWQNKKSVFPELVFRTAYDSGIVDGQKIIHLIQRTRIMSLIFVSGFYIFGNIEMLKEKSELWKKIAVTLENNGSLGDTLTVKCQNHPEQVRTVSTANVNHKIN